MKASEIRAWMDSQPKAEGSNLPEGWWMAEIAAQLAELNTRLKMITMEQDGHPVLATITRQV